MLLLFLVVVVFVSVVVIFFEGLSTSYPVKKCGSQFCCGGWQHKPELPGFGNYGRRSLRWSSCSTYSYQGTPQREQCKLLFNLPLVLPVDSYPTPCPGLHTRHVLALFSYCYSSFLIFPCFFLLLLAITPCYSLVFLDTSCPGLHSMHSMQLCIVCSANVMYLHCFHICT